MGEADFNQFFRQRNQLFPLQQTTFSTLTFSTSGALYWMKQLLIIKKNSVMNGCSFPHEHFPIVPGIKNVI